MNSIHQIISVHNKHKDVSHQSIDNSILEFDFSLCHGPYCFC